MAKSSSSSFLHSKPLHSFRRGTNPTGANLLRSLTYRLTKLFCVPPCFSLKKYKNISFDLLFFVVFVKSQDVVLKNESARMISRNFFLKMASFSGSFEWAKKRGRIPERSEKKGCWQVLREKINSFFPPFSIHFFFPGKGFCQGGGGDISSACGSPFPFFLGIEISEKPKRFIKTWKKEGKKKTLHFPHYWATQVGHECISLSSTIFLFSLLRCLLLGGNWG